MGTTKQIHIRGTRGGRAAKEPTTAVVPGEISKQEMLQPRRRGLAQGGGSKDKQRGLEGPCSSEQREGRLEWVHVFLGPKDLDSIS